MKTIIKQGANFSPCVRLTYRKNGASVNLTGCTAYSQMRTEPGGDLVATAQCAIDPSQGRITAEYLSDITDMIPVGDYGYDIWLVTDATDGQKRPVWSEQVTVIGRYTDNFGA